MFYFYYESRSKGANDPVILWMTGELWAVRLCWHALITALAQPTSLNPHASLNP